MTPNVKLYLSTHRPSLRVSVNPYLLSWNRETRIPITGSPCCETHRPLITATLLRITKRPSWNTPSNTIINIYEKIRSSIPINTQRLSYRTFLAETENQLRKPFAALFVQARSEPVRKLLKASEKFVINLQYRFPTHCSRVSLQLAIRGVCFPEMCSWFAKE